MDRVTRSIKTLNIKREKKDLEFLKTNPPIKKRAKLASGKETEFKKWLPLVRAINRAIRTKGKKLLIVFMMQLYPKFNKDY